MNPTAEQNARAWQAHRIMCKLDRHLVIVQFRQPGVRTTEQQIVKETVKLRLSRRLEALGLGVARDIVSFPISRDAGTMDAVFILKDLAKGMPLLRDELSEAGLLPSVTIAFLDSESEVWRVFFPENRSTPFKPECR